MGGSYPADRRAERELSRRADKPARAGRAALAKKAAVEAATTPDEVEAVEWT